MQAEREALNELSGLVIGAAIAVHRELGPGLLESAYEHCLCYELSRLENEFKRQVDLPLKYKNVSLDCGYKIDLIVRGVLIVELKTVERLLPIHEAQLLTYLKLDRRPLGLLINFNVAVLKEGIKRIILDLP